MASFTIKIDPGRARQVIGKFTEDGVRRAAEKTRDRARQNITSAGRVDTGAMRKNIQIRPRPGDAFRASCDVTAAQPYSWFQEMGTRGSTARPGGWLVFTPKGSSTVVFAKKTRPVKGAHFMNEALTSLSPEDYG